MKRLNKLMNFLLEVEALQRQYEIMAHDLLGWIERQIVMLRNLSFPNNLPGLLTLLADFKTYRTVVKPPRFVDRGHLEAHLFGIQTRLFAHKQPMYHPPEGLLISDVNERWQVLEQCEHAREIALREAVQRQEQLHQLADRFENKAALREVWLADNEKIISYDDFGNDLSSALAAQKRHEAIDTDVQAHRERIEAVTHLAQQLQEYNFHRVHDIADRADAILTQWRALEDRLKARRSRLDETLHVQMVVQGVKDVLVAIKELSDTIRATPTGSHLAECEEVLQRHLLRDSDISLLLDRIYASSAQAQVFIDQVRDRIVRRRGNGARETK